MLLQGLACAVPAEPACGPLRLGLRDYPRVYQRDAKGVYGGLDKEFFEALAQRSGCKFEIRLESQPRLWDGLRGGRIDLASWVIQTEERSHTVNVIPLLEIRLMAVTWRDVPELTQAEFLANTKLTAVRVRQSVHGPGYDELLNKLLEQGRLSEVADVDTALRVFSARRVALLVAYPWALFGQSEQWMSQVRLSDWHPTAGVVHSGLAISHRVSAADARKLEDALRSMQRDGSLARMVARHLPMDLTKLVPAPK
ncbi:MAG TPA: transporter substrate-binding domain-containing protein [Burkholderiaceae bacterium]